MSVSEMELKSLFAMLTVQQLLFILSFSGF